MYCCLSSLFVHIFFFFFNDPATPEISPLPLHAALPISDDGPAGWCLRRPGSAAARSSAAPRHGRVRRPQAGDRKSTRLNSSHLVISYAVFCLKKKKNEHTLLYILMHDVLQTYLASSSSR